MNWKSWKRAIQGLVIAVILAVIAYFIPWLWPRNNPPIAVISAFPRDGLAPLAVKLDAANSSDPDGDNLKFTWSIDGIVISDKKMFDHTFIEPGVHNVTLVVDDQHHHKAEASVPLSVVKADPKVILYSEKDFAGDTREILRPGNDNLGAFGDKTRSIRIIGGEWTFYDVAGWNKNPIHGVGATWTLPPGSYPDLAVIGCDRVISSVQLKKE